MPKGFCCLFVVGVCLVSSGGGGRDMGYPRTLERPDGKVVTVYYFQPGDSPYRRIIATIWDPGSR